MKKILIFVGIIMAFCLYCIVSHEMEWKAMATMEGRQEVIAEKYEGAVITSEKEVNGYIISAYEMDETHGYAVFKPVKEGKYDLQTYSGEPRVKSRLVMGLDELGDGLFEVFVCADERIEYLDVTRMETYEGGNLQSENIYFEDTNIAVLKTLPDVWAWETIVVGYDAEGNAYMLDR